MTAERIGFYGGTFDPPHKGHAAAAAAFAAAVRPDRLYIIPNALPPLKDGRIPAPPADRLAMAALREGWEIISCSAVRWKFSCPAAVLK